jgi:hypothetical protein
VGWNLRRTKSNPEACPSAQPKRVPIRFPEPPLITTALKGVEVHPLGGLRFEGATLRSLGGAFAVRKAACAEFDDAPAEEPRYALGGARAAMIALGLELAVLLMMGVVWKLSHLWN